MRKLQTSDIFNTLRLIKKVDLKEELKPVIKMAADKELKIEDVGITGILSVIEILTEKKAEQGMYEILAGPFEMTAKEVEKLELDELVINIETLAKENNLKRFFSLLAGLISKK